MGVTIYGRPQGKPNGNSTLELTVHHPNGARAVHRVNLWDTGDILAHHVVDRNDSSARGPFADWVDENSEHFQSVPQEYRPYLGQLLRRGHRYPPEPPTQMSRRNSLKRYTSSTVARVMGHGQYANETAPSTSGSRLATVLREIKHGVGKDNPRLQQLTQHALGGSYKGEVYTGIRDELFRTKDPRAVQLARMYNWHKVGEGLEREKHLRDFVHHVAKGTRHEGSSQMFRQFYNGTVHQVDGRGNKGGADDHTRALMYRAMQKHLMNQTGKEHSYTDIEDALRRLGETEENKEKAGKMNGGAKFESPDYQHPAYTGTPKEGKYPPTKQVTPIEKRAPGQYRRKGRFNLK